MNQWIQLNNQSINLSSTMNISKKMNKNLIKIRSKSYIMSRIMGMMVTMLTMKETVKLKQYKYKKKNIVILSKLFKKTIKKILRSSNRSRL